jgi:hypothetical protein
MASDWKRLFGAGLSGMVTMPRTEPVKPIPDPGLRAGRWRRCRNVIGVMLVVTIGQTAMLVSVSHAQTSVIPLAGWRARSCTKRAPANTCG